MVGKSSALALATWSVVPAAGLEWGATLRLSGACSAKNFLNNMVFQHQGFTASGAPWYMGSTDDGVDEYLYWDPDCGGLGDGQPHPWTWWIVTGTVPNHWAKRDLGGCSNYHARVSDRKNSYPPNVDFWYMYCGDAGIRKLSIVLEDITTTITSTSTTTTSSLGFAVAVAITTLPTKPAITVNGFVVAVACVVGCMCGCCVVCFCVFLSRWRTSRVAPVEDESVVVAPNRLPPFWKASSMGPPLSFETVSAEEQAALVAMLTASFRGIKTRDRSGQVPQGLRLVTASRVQNSALWERYGTARRSIRNKRSHACTSVATFGGTLATEGGLLQELRNDLEDTVNEVFLWHGTSPERAHGICLSGFKLTFAGSGTGSMYGKGLYFAECSSKSDEYASNDKNGIHKHLLCLLLCRVTLGEVLHLTAGGDAIHPMITAGIESKVYDSVLGDRQAAVGTYREFVVYKEEQVCPAYVITYERIFAD